MSSLETLVGAMTLEQFAQHANITIDQLVAAALGNSRGAASLASNGNRSAKPVAKATASAGQRASASKGSSAPRERGSIGDDEILAILRTADEAVSSEFVRAQIGGTPAQVRAALQRLRDAKRLRVHGAKRGTRYALR
jgi:hypothetical protein